MKTIVRISLYIVLIVIQLAVCKAQDLCVQIEQDEENPVTIVPEVAGITLIADATPANGENSQCISFDWTDEWGGDWKTGDVTGFQSKLTYYAQGYLYGSTAVMTCTVTDTAGNTNFCDITLATPVITSAYGGTDLSYYNGTTFSGQTATGGDTSIRLNVKPTATDIFVNYAWHAQGAGITDNPDASSDFDIITSTGPSSHTGDQGVYINDPQYQDLMCASISLTVHLPTSDKLGAVSYGTEGPVWLPDPSNDSVPAQYKGWTTQYPIQVLDQLGNGSIVPDGTPVYEGFDAPDNFFTNDWAIRHVTDDFFGGLATWYTAGGWMVYAGQDGDDYAVGIDYTWAPQPVFQTDPGASDGVFDVDQRYSAGGTVSNPGGVNIDTHTLTFFRGNAQQNRSP